MGCSVGVDGSVSTGSSLLLPLELGSGKESVEGSSLGEVEGWKNAPKVALVVSGSTVTFSSIAPPFGVSGSTLRDLLEEERSFGVVEPEEAGCEAPSLNFESCSFQNESADTKPLCFLEVGTLAVSSGGVDSIGYSVRPDDQLTVYETKESAIVALY